jgi:hypothetical protein
MNIKEKIFQRILLFAGVLVLLSSCSENLPKIKDSSKENLEFLNNIETVNEDVISEIDSLSLLSTRMAVRNSIIVHTTPIDSLANRLKITNIQLLNLYAGNILLNEEEKLEILEAINNINDNGYEGISLDEYDFSSIEIDKTTSDKKIDSILKYSEYNDNLLVSKILEYNLNIKYNELNEEIINEEFGFFTQYVHMFKSLFQSEEEIYKSWYNIVTEKYQIKNFIGLNLILNNYLNFISTKHHYFFNKKANYNISFINSKEINKAINLKKTSLIETNIGKLNNELNDVLIESFISFIIFIILRIIFSKYSEKLIIEMKGWQEFGELLVNHGGSYLAKKGNKNAGFIKSIGNFINSSINSYQLEKKREELKTIKQTWSIILNILLVVGLLIYFIPKDIAIEESFREDLNELTLDLVDRNKEVNQDLDIITTLNYEN